MQLAPLFTKLALKKYLITLLLVAAATWLQWILFPLIDPAPYLLFYPVVIFAALYGDGLSAIIFSTIVIQYVFVPPMYSFSMEWPGDYIRQGMYIISAVMIRNLTRKLSDALTAAQKAEISLATTLASIGDAVLSTDAHGNIVFMNAVAENITGWPLNEARNKPLASVFRIINEKTRAPLENPVQKVLIQGRIVDLAIGTTLIRRDGTEVHIEDSAAPIRGLDKTLNGVVLVFRDATESKRAQNVLKIERDKLDAIFRNNEIGIGLADPHGNTFSLNPSAMRIHGFFEEKERITRLADFADNFVFQYPDGKPMSVQEWPLSRAIRGETVRNMDVKLIRKAPKTEKFLSYSAVPIHDHSGELLYYVFNIVDISERKLSEERIRESERTMRAIVDQMPIGLILVEAPSGKLLIGNKEIPRIFRHPIFDAVDVEDYRFWKGFHPDGSPYLPEEWPVARSCLRGEVVTDEVIRIERGNGESGVISTNSAPVCDENWKIVAAVTTVIDITEHIRIQEDLRAAVRARDEFLSIASHELKTPLTSLKLQTEVRQRWIKNHDVESFSLERLGKYFESNARQIDKLTRLIDDMLDISRIGTGKLGISREIVDICELTREVIERHSAQFEAFNCQITLKSCAPAHGLWDRFRIEQVLTNLLTNAMKYGAGNPVTVSIENDGKKVYVHLKDQGIGIAPEHQERIFRRFERAISASEISGLGLGLYIAHQIVEMHGGELRVESEIGKGAMFTLILPMEDRPATFESSGPFQKN